MREQNADLIQLEQMTLSQIKPINNALANLFGEVVPPIRESTIHWISSAQAEKMAAEAGIEDRQSMAFCRSGQIYFVKELVSKKNQEMADFPAPFNMPIMITMHAMIHEQLHIATEASVAGEVTHDVALTCWQADFEEATESREDLTEEQKTRYREVDKLLGNDEEVKVMVEGGRILLGTSNRMLCEYGHQIDEDLIDIFTATTLAEVMKNRIGIDPKRMREITINNFVLNAKNRPSLDPTHIKPLVETLYHFVTPQPKLKEMAWLYFKGQLIEKLAEPLDEEQKMYLSAYFVLGATAEVIDLLDK